MTRGAVEPTVARHRERAREDGRHSGAARLPAALSQIEFLLGASDGPADLIGAGIDRVTRAVTLQDSSMDARMDGRAHPAPSLHATHRNPH